MLMGLRNNNAINNNIIDDSDVKVNDMQDGESHCILAMHRSF